MHVVARIGSGAALMAASLAVAVLLAEAAVRIYHRTEGRPLFGDAPFLIQDARLGWFIVLGTIPIAIFGFLFKDQIESGARSLYLIGSALMQAADPEALTRELTGADEGTREHLLP